MHDPSRIIVRLAEESEMDHIFKLRYRVFNEELGVGFAVPLIEGQDRDVYDDYCDHLIAIDQEIDRIVGTCRLLPRSRISESVGFCSENEFDLLTFLRNCPEDLIEIGRSCVHENYRDGSVIFCLWEAIMNYMHAQKFRYAIGAASIYSKDAHLLSQIYTYFELRNALSPDHLRVQPRDANRIEGFSEDCGVIPESDIENELPGLIQQYLRLGAQVCGPPAHDFTFFTTDFFMLFDVEKLNQRYRKRIQNWSSVFRDLK